MIGEILKGAKFIWQNRDDINRFKKELLDIKEKVKKAREDDKITREETVGILKEIDDVFNLIIETLDKDENSGSGSSA